jgi:hypothetical protein
LQLCNAGLNAKFWNNTTSKKIKKMNAWNLTLLCLIFLGLNVFSQDVESKRTSIKTGIGLAVNEGQREIGVGLVYSVGFQKSYGEKNKFRINPNLLFGGFLPAGITDQRDQYYKLTNLGFDVHYDLLRARWVSLVTTFGGFMNLSRGLIGTGGMPGESNVYQGSDYFLDLYFGGKGSLALRFDQKHKKLAYEIRPFNLYFGNKAFTLGSFMIGVDIKLNK